MIKNINSRHALYQRQLREKATKAEIAFAILLGELGIRYMFQKGFFKPYHLIVDFYIPRWKIAFEVDGEYHDTIKSKDTYRDNSLLKVRGVRTYRFTNDEVLITPSQVRIKLVTIFA